MLIRVPALGMAAVLALLIACKSPTWHLSVYPTGNHLDATRDLGEYPNLEDCRRAALQYLHDVGAAARGDYECGKNCREYGDRKTQAVTRQMTGGPFYVCDETSR